MTGVPDARGFLRAPIRSAFFAEGMGERGGVAERVNGPTGGLRLLNLPLTARMEGVNLVMARGCGQIVNLSLSW